MVNILENKYGLMKIFYVIFFFWLVILSTISMSPKKYGLYEHWDVVKQNLINHPELKIIDFETGVSWNVVVGNENILGSLHADVEPKTIKDFETAMKIWGNYSWSPRAVLVYMPNGKVIAASMHNMPHAGVEEEPYLKIVNNRTNGYGTGRNRDFVKNNGMSGHVCLHFYGSKSHRTKTEVPEHQDKVKVAANKSIYHKKGLQ